MKIALPIIGIVLLLVGVVWIGQGLNYIPGSFMTGQSFWAWAGLICAVAGVFTLFVALARRGAS